MPFLPLDPGWVKNQDPVNIPDHISESLEIIFWVHNTYIFYVDRDLGSGIFLARDPGCKFRIWDQE
jgi:hypothetical protein